MLFTGSTVATDANILIDQKGGNIGRRLEQYTNLGDSSLDSVLDLHCHTELFTLMPFSEVSEVFHLHRPITQSCLLF